MTRRLVSFRCALGLSGAVHVVAVAACLWFAAVGEQKTEATRSEKGNDLVAINLGGDLSGSAVVDDQPPALLEANADPAEKAHQDEPEASVAGAPDGVSDGSPSGGDLGMVWTPPPPGAYVEGGSIYEPDRIILPQAIEPVVLADGGVPARLVSFEPMVSADLAVAAEARRLTGRGLIKLSVQIDEEGYTVGCSVVQSSGSNLLDDNACLMVLGYRYEPARSAKGAARFSSAYEYIEWGDDALMAPLAMKDVSPSATTPPSMLNH